MDRRGPAEGHWLYGVLPNLVLPLLMVVNAAVLFPVMGSVFDDPPASGYIAVVLLAVLLSVAEYALAMRLLKLPGSWHGGLPERAGRLWLAGIAVAFLFAAGLFGVEQKSAADVRARRAEREREDREMRDRLSALSDPVRVAEQQRVMRESRDAALAKIRAQEAHEAAAKQAAEAESNRPENRAVMGTWAGTRGQRGQPDFLYWRVQLKPMRKASFSRDIPTTSSGGACEWVRSGDSIVLTLGTLPGLAPTQTFSLRGGDGADATLISPEGLELRRVAEKPERTAATRTPPAQAQAGRASKPSPSTAPARSP
jgi:hypothetical protein